MVVKGHIIDRKFLRNPRPFFIQSALASLIIFLTLLVMGLISPVIVAAIGATTFIVFAMPEASTAGIRSIFGGHMIGLACGLAFAWSPYAPLGASLAVGVSIFLMVVLDAEHPPAAGTALGIALAGYNVPAILFVIGAAAFLAIIHRGLRRWMVDLV